MAQRPRQHRDARVADEGLRARLTPKRRLARDITGEWLVTEPCLADLDLLRRLLHDRRDRGSFEVGAAARALRSTAHLLWGERVTAPIHRHAEHKLHRSHVLVLSCALDTLLHPDKQKRAPHGSQRYNDRTRRCLARWFWAATFAQTHIPPGKIRDVADELLAWACAQSPEPPPDVRKLRSPTASQLDSIRYARGDFRIAAIRALLGQRDLEDPLTGQRLDGEAVFGRLLEDHHLFPRRWIARNLPADTARADAVANLTPITTYTNRWISDRDPGEYLGLLRDRVGEQRLRQILDRHCVDLDLLAAGNFSALYDNRRSRLHAWLVEQLEGPV